jgi:hypothetical protein
MDGFVLLVRMPEICVQLMGVAKPFFVGITTDILE